MSSSQLRETEYPFPANLSYASATSARLVFAFVRHPISRFVSGYSEKMVRDWRRKDIPKSVRHMRDQVLAQASRDLNE